MDGAETTGAVYAKRVIDLGAASKRSSPIRWKSQLGHRRWAESFSPLCQIVADDHVLHINIEHDHK